MEPYTHGHSIEAQGNEGRRFSPTARTQISQDVLVPVRAQQL